MQPAINQGEYVFCSVSKDEKRDWQALLTFEEQEGVTLVLSRSDADRLRLQYEGSWAWISLTVHSSLSAVGLLAEVSKALAQQSIPCNVVSAYHHDHLFVPMELAEEALAALRSLSERNDDLL